MESFSAQRVRRSATLRLEGALEKVFPLFEPLNEKRWEADWEFMPIFPQTSEPGEGFVFTTQNAEGPDSIWVMSRHDVTARAIEYYKIEPGHKVVRIEISCRALDAKTTSTSVTYTLTGLSPAGNMALENFTEAYYAKWLDSWEKAINYHLRTGKTLPRA